MKLKIVRLENNKNLPEYKSDGAAGMDLYAAIEEPITLRPLARKLIPTGLKIELEKGYEAQVRPRSGMALKNGISVLNTPGTIDCLSGNTRIKILDGTFDTLENIVKRVNNGEKIYVYSIDDTDGKLAPGLITHAINKGYKKTVKITFDNGTQIICTPNHEFRNYKGNYIKASDMQIGTRVSPLNTHFDKCGYEIFTTLRYSKIGKYERVHRSIYESYNNLTLDTMPQYVHHIDENVINNLPDNLQGVTSKEHYHIHEDTHSKMYEWMNTEDGKEHLKCFGERMANHPNRLSAMQNNPNFKGFVGNETEEHKDKIRQAQLKAWKNKSDKRKESLFRRNEQGLKNALSIVRAIVEDGLKFTTENYKIYKKRFIQEGKFKESKKLNNLLNLFNHDKQAVIEAAFNHYVTSIEDNGECEVFDITVDKYHNFLAEDIFVHNCDYRGEVGIIAVNLSTEEYTIQPQERIAQLVITKVEQAEIEVVTELSDTERGEGGFGHSGT